VTPNALIAKAVQRERNRVGMSLSALAAKADLAKSTLSQLEAGQANPSVETLWAIASALEIPFSFLFEVTTPEMTLIRADEGIKVSSDTSSASAVLLANCPPARRRDLYRMNLERGSVRAAEAHPEGTIEHVFVSSGSICAGPVGDTKELHVGDYFRYPGDVDHAYEAISETASFMLVMESPK